MRLLQDLNRWFAFAAIALLTLSGCSEGRPLWRDQKLPSGRSVKVTSLNLAWGSEHDERIPANDCIMLQIIYSKPGLNEQDREREVSESFELIRPISEQWGLSLRA